MIPKNAPNKGDLFRRKRGIKGPFHEKLLRKANGMSLSLFGYLILGFSGRPPSNKTGREPWHGHDLSVCGGPDVFPGPEAEIFGSKPALDGAGLI